MWNTDQEQHENDIKNEGESGFSVCSDFGDDDDRSTASDKTDATLEIVSCFFFWFPVNVLMFAMFYSSSRTKT